LTNGNDPVAENERLLVSQAGGYLRNVIRQPLVTCSVCGTPVDGWQRCWRCNQDAATLGVADIVAPLTYGIERTQSGILLRHYKDDLSVAARQQHARTIFRLLYLGIMLHEKCIATTVGQPVTSRVTVPSLQGRSGVHPLTALARSMKAVNESLELAPAPGATNSRIVSASQLQVVSNRSLQGEHVLVLDDTWTTGSRTQSAALTLRAAGVQHVSVMVIGRWLSQTYGNNGEFIKTRLQEFYNPRICPVAGGDCP
jgi:hypothetical protein